MRRSNKFLYIRLLLVLVCLVSLLIFFYLVKLQETVEHNIMLSVHETALHDKRALRTCVEFSLDELAGVAKRVVTNGRRSIEDMENSLNLQGATTSFSRIFIIAEDGRIFTDKFIVYSPGKGAIGGRFDFRHLFSDQPRDELVMRFDDDAEFAGISRDSILFGVRLHDFEVEGIRMAGILGLTDINFLQEHMIIESFVQNGQPYGFSSVIDSRGYYVVGRHKSVYLNEESNFFTRLFRARSSSMGRKEIMEKMARRETFSFYADVDEGEKLIYMAPFMAERKDGPEWYFVMAVSKNVLKEREAMYTLLSLALLAAVVASLALVLFYAMRTRHKLALANERISVRSQFLSSMSEEIKTPLNGLVGLNHLIASHLGDQGRLPQVRDWVGKSGKLAEYLVLLTNNILEMSQLQYGQLAINRSSFSLPEMLENIVPKRMKQAAGKKIALSLEQDLPFPDIVGDEPRIRQVVAYLLDNALKFTPQGSVSLSVSQKKLDGNHVRTIFVCADTGLGIRENFLPRIFEPFAQEESDLPSDAPRGTGLGLPICKGLLEAMGGTLTVVSKHGEGSTFTATISTPIAPRLTEQPKEKTASPSAQGRILLAENAEFNADFLFELLTGKGFSVTHVRTGREAFETFAASETGEFSVLLLDSSLPVMDACQTANAIRRLARQDAHSVIIYALASGQQSVAAARADECGLSGIIDKPLDIQELLRKISIKPVK